MYRAVKFIFIFIVCVSAPGIACDNEDLLNEVASDMDDSADSLIVVEDGKMFQKGQLQSNGLIHFTLKNVSL